MQPAISVRLQTALSYAALGIPVFPCLPGRKVPLPGTNGFYDATTDEATIRSWWAQDDYNVAMEPGRVGWCVLDPDGPVGESSLLALELENGFLAETREVRTPRGRHLYLKGSLPPSANRLGPKLDTRGETSYVLLPGSVTEDGRYEIVRDCDPAPLPEWVRGKLGSATVERAHAAPAIPEDRLDLGGNIGRARSLLDAYADRGDFAVSGAGGNDRTYRLACEVLNLGLSVDKAAELIDDHWNLYCSPPWGIVDLRRVVENAARYAQNGMGAWAALPAAEVWSALDPALLQAAEPERRIRFRLETEEEQEAAEPPSWIIPGLIQERSTVLMVGASGSYKSFMALDIALGTAAGVETFGHTPEPGLVVYAANEGRTGIKQARRRAWKTLRAVEEAIPNFLVCPAPMLVTEGQQFVQDLKEQLAGRPLKLLFLDTTAKVMAGLNENDARDAGQFIQFCEVLVETFGCSVVAIHHTGKDGDRGARGSSAFYAGFDTVLEVRADKEQKAVEVWVRKHKDADERERPWCFQGQVLGASLAFAPISGAEHHQLTHVEQALGKKAIGSTLRQLGATGQENGVVTMVLATELTPSEQRDAPEVRQAAIAATARQLGALARTKLAPYAYRTPSGLVWALPSEEDGPLDTA